MSGNDKMQNKKRKNELHSKNLEIKTKTKVTEQEQTRD